MLRVKLLEDILSASPFILPLCLKATHKHISEQTSIKIPATFASADKIRTGRITKRGSKWLRKVLIDAVTLRKGKPNKFSVFYLNLKKKKGTGKAKVATARKLCSVVFAMLTDKQPFREFTPVKKR